jgi:hypothetical protein
MPKTERSRALIYVRGTSEETDAQLDTASEYCTRRGYEIAGIVRDRPGQTAGYHDAHRMLRHGEADVITIASITHLPPRVMESATGSLSPVRIREVLRRESRRRTRPVPRGGGAA